MIVIEQLNLNTSFVNDAQRELLQVGAINITRSSSEDEIRCETIVRVRNVCSIVTWAVVDALSIGQRQRGERVETGVGEQQSKSVS